MTFSESLTPASGSASTSSPGPGIARFTPRLSVDFFFDAEEGSDRGGIFLEELDRIELYRQLIYRATHFKIVFRIRAAIRTWFRCSSRHPLAARAVLSNHFLLDLRKPAHPV